MHADGVRRGVRRHSRARRSAPAEGADVGRVGSRRASALCQQVGAGGLAVGARDADDVQCERRPAEEPVGDAADQSVPGRSTGAAKICRGRGRRLDVRGRAPTAPRSRRAPRPRRRTQPMRASPAQREEQAAGAHVAAVESEVLDLRGVGRQPRAMPSSSQRRSAERRSWRARSPATSVAAGTFCRSSGGTSISRSAPDITLENTGAATWPPWCSRRRSARRSPRPWRSSDAMAGTSPANTAMYLSVE